MKHLAIIQSEFIKVAGKIMGPGIPDGSGPYSGKNKNFGIPDGTGPMKDDPNCIMNQADETDEKQIDVNKNLKGFVVNIEKATVDNNFFRKVLYTAHNSQLVLMALKSNEDIGEEVHDLDQFFRVDEGSGKAVINDVEHIISDGFAFVVPAHAKHNVIAGDEGMKLYSIYSPPNHADKTIHKTKEEAEANKEHFDGKTTE